MSATFGIAIFAAGTNSDVNIISGNVSAITGTAIYTYGNVTMTGGEVSATTGDAISANGNVNITNGVVSATTGYAINVNGAVAVGGGFVFAYGIGIADVIEPSIFFDYFCRRLDGRNVTPRQRVYTVSF